MSQESPEEVANLDSAPPPSGDENEPQETTSGTEMPHHPGEEDHALGFDFEVKEQDRWLPIANGKSSAPLPSALRRLSRTVVRTGSYPVTHRPCAMAPAFWNAFDSGTQRLRCTLPVCCPATYITAVRVSPAGPVESEAHPPTVTCSL